MVLQGSTPCSILCTWCLISLPQLAIFPASFMGFGVQTGTLSDKMLPLNAPLKQGPQHYGGRYDPCPVVLTPPAPQANRPGSGDRQSQLVVCRNAHLAQVVSVVAKGWGPGLWSEIMLAYSSFLSHVWFLCRPENRIGPLYFKFAV